MTGDEMRARVTLSEHTIHNPDESRHFMRVKPAGRRVRILHGSLVVADTCRASRVIEAGKDLYDPVLCIPRPDVTGKLAPSASVHMPR